MPKSGNTGGNIGSVEEDLRGSERTLHKSEHYVQVLEGFTSPHWVAVIFC